MSFFIKIKGKHVVFLHFETWDIYGCVDGMVTIGVDVHLLFARRRYAELFRKRI